ncbi:MAG: hypothetical protein MUC97_18640 [Bernardetiaceae bacterium]|nr:hypothetical protein [Bernardetiaceae bacterium]
MRTAFLVLVFVHGLIHLLGFVKGFGLREVRELTLFISKPLGVWWLAAAGFFLAFGWLYGANVKYSWAAGFLAVAISQILIILFWKDAKFGTVPNLIVLAVSSLAWGQSNFRQLAQTETEALVNSVKILPPKVLLETDLTPLPAPVQQWLRRSGMVGQPMIKIGRLTQKAEMKMKPDQTDWMKANALQYSVLEVPAFIWTVEAPMNKLLYFQGRDKFVNGQGEMLIKVNSLFNVVHARGEKLNEGTMQRYLGEMVWFPSLAASPYITWEELSNHSAKATMTYQGTQGSGTFYFSPEGDFVKFSAWRFKDNQPNAKRYEWVLLVEDYRTFAGIKVPSKMNATWRLEAGDWTWLRLEITDLQFNENAVR